MTTPLTRRTVVFGLGAGAVACAASRKDTVLAPSPTPSDSASAAPGSPLILGAGRHRYEWVKGWAKLPDGVKLDNMHGGLAVDAQGRVYIGARNSDRAVMVFDPEGQLITLWGDKLKGGVHGMMLRKEGSEEFLYLCPGKGPHEVIKTTLTGEVVLALPWPESCGVYQSRAEYKPTNCAVAPNGDIYVGDGYGKFWIHHYNGRGEYLSSWGGPGAGPGQFAQPHGIWIDARGETPVVVVADRANHRLQIHALDGKHLRIIQGDVRLPSAFDQEGDDLLIVDLDGRLT